MGIAPRFELDYRVRFDEAGEDGLLRASGLARYAQDIAWRHSEAAGYDRDWYRQRGRHWLVRSLSLQVLAGAHYGSTLRVRTEVSGWRRVWARRHTRFEAADGGLVAQADTDWVLITTNGRLARVPDEIVALFPPGMSFRPEKVELPPMPAEAETLEHRVRSVEVDPLGHVNHAAYVDLVDEACATLAPHGLRSYRLEYLRPARPDVLLHVTAWRHAAGVACQISEGGDEVLRATART